MIDFDNGASFSFPADKTQGLNTASPKALKNIQLLPSGTAVRWPDLDVSLDILLLMRGVFGNKQWMGQLKMDRIEREHPDYAPMMESALEGAFDYDSLEYSTKEIYSESNEAT